MIALEFVRPGSLCSGDLAMRRLLVMVLSVVWLSALTGCATYKPPHRGATLNVVNPTDYSWRLYVDGKCSGKIGPQATRSIVISLDSHSLRAVNRLLLGLYNRQRIATSTVKPVDMQRKMEFVIADYETRSSYFFWFSM